ncbi:aldolase/synthase, partial [Acinetobacter baumannii]
DTFLSLYPEKFDFSKDIPELNDLRQFLTFFG